MLPVKAMILVLYRIEVLLNVLCVSTDLVVTLELPMYGWAKKVSHKVSSDILTSFQNSFPFTVGGKFAIKRIKDPTAL